MPLLRHGPAAAGLLLAASVLATVLATAAPAAAQSAPGAPSPPPTVTVDVVRDKDVAPTSSFIGNVQAIRDFDARARVEGFIERVAFQEGQDLTAGTLLYVIEQAPYQAALDGAKADLAGAQAQQREADSAFTRAQELRTRGNISQADLDQAQASRETAAADVMQAQAKLRQAELNFSYTQITAPFDGRIGATSVTEGDLVGPSSGSLATVVQLNPIRVVFSISDRELLQTQQQLAGQSPAEAVNAFVPSLRLADGMDYPEKGRLSFVSNRIDPQTGTIPVYVDFANPSALLLPGQYVTVLIRPAREERHPVVPVAAIQQDQQGSYVLVLDSGNHVQRRPVETGSQIDQQLVIDKGLTAGETIVVEGVQKVRPGMVVHPVPAAQTAERPKG